MSGNSDIINTCLSLILALNADYIFFKDKVDLLEALKHTTDMLNKLSSTARMNNADHVMSLSPKSYYELCN